MSKTIIEKVIEQSKWLRKEPIEHNIIYAVKGDNIVSFKDISGKSSPTSVYFNPWDGYHFVEELKSGYIAIHNHPNTKRAYPSGADRNRVKEGKLILHNMNIPYIDELIIADENYYSFRENNNVLKKDE